MMAISEPAQVSENPVGHFSQDIKGKKGVLLPVKYIFSFLASLWLTFA